MQWFDTGFDPLKALEVMHDNQIIFNNLLQQQRQQIQQLNHRIMQQEKIIDDVLKALESTNKSQEILLNSFSQQMQSALEKING